MKSLILDTSGENALIALSNQGKLHYHLALSSMKSSSLLASHIQTALKEANFSLHQLNYISVGIGPGSFLGTRIGVMIAKSLAYGLNIPLVSFCSLELYQPEELIEFAVVTDAKSKGLYLLKGNKTSTSTHYDPHPTLCSIEEFPALHPETLTLITPNKEIIASKLSSYKNPLLEVTPSLESLCMHCYQQFSTSSWDSIENLSIHYLRLS